MVIRPEKSLGPPCPCPWRPRREARDRPGIRVDVTAGIQNNLYHAGAKTQYAAPIDPSSI